MVLNVFLKMFKVIPCLGFVFSDDVYLMMGMQEACRGHIQMHVINEKLSSSSNKDVFIFSFEKMNFMDYILKIDEQRIYKFIVIINTPMNTSEVKLLTLWNYLLKPSALRD